MGFTNLSLKFAVAFPSSWYSSSYFLLVFKIFVHPETKIQYASYVEKGDSV